MEAPRTSILDFEMHPYCLEMTSDMMCATTRKMVKMRPMSTLNMPSPRKLTRSSFPELSADTRRLTGTEKKMTITVAAIFARMFFLHRCFPVSATLCHTRSLGPGAGSVCQRPNCLSSCTCDAMTASICLENTTMELGEGVSSWR